MVLGAITIAFGVLLGYHGFPDLWRAAEENGACMVESFWIEAEERSDRTGGARTTYTVLVGPLDGDSGDDTLRLSESLELQTGAAGVTGLKIVRTRCRIGPDNARSLIDQRHVQMVVFGRVLEAHRQIKVSVLRTFDVDPRTDVYSVNDKADFPKFLDVIGSLAAEHLDRMVGSPTRTIGFGSVPAPGQAISSGVRSDQISRLSAVGLFREGRPSCLLMQAFANAALRERRSDADDLFEKVSSSCRKERDIVGRAVARRGDIWRERGLSHRDTGQLRRAVEFYEQALSNEELEKADPDFWAETAINQAHVLVTHSQVRPAVGDIRKAAARIERALTRLRSSHDHAASRDALRLKADLERLARENAERSRQRPLSQPARKGPRYHWGWRTCSQARNLHGNIFGARTCLIRVSP